MTVKIHSMYCGLFMVQSKKFYDNAMLVSCPVTLAVQYKRGQINRRTCMLHMCVSASPVSKSLNGIVRTSTALFTGERLTY